MRKFIGKTVSAIGAVIAIGSGLLIMGGSLLFLGSKYGFFGVLIGFLFTPITLLAVSVWAGISSGDWWPIITVWVGHFGGVAIVFVGGLISGAKEN